MDETSNAKKGLRVRLRAQREAISKGEIRKKSQSATKWVIDSEVFGRARILALYRACFGEVDTDDIFDAARSAEETVLYPRTDKRRSLLLFGAVDNLDVMTPGAWDIPEPPPEAELVPLDRADLVIVPGVAFDRCGGRLGMGGGFYDRMLADLPVNVVCIGLAYDFQVVESVPLEENDQRLDCLVTESGLQCFPERG